LIAEVVVELIEECGVSRVRVWRVVLSWGNMLGVGVFLFRKYDCLREISLKSISLLIESSFELSRSFVEGSIESFVVNFYLCVKLGLSIDFILGEIFSELSTESIEIISLHLAE